jgi:hypothetical protein
MKNDNLIDQMTKHKVFTIFDILSLMNVSELELSNIELPRINDIGVSLHKYSLDYKYVVLLLHQSEDKSTITSFAIHKIENNAINKKPFISFRMHGCVDDVFFSPDNSHLVIVFDDCTDIYACTLDELNNFDNKHIRKFDVGCNKKNVFYSMNKTGLIINTSSASFYYTFNDMKMIQLNK